MAMELPKAMARLAVQEIRNEPRQYLTLQHADAITELLNENERKDNELAAANARIAELEAQVAAVPEAAIRSWFGDENPVHPTIAPEVREILVWLAGKMTLRPQVQP